MCYITIFNIIFDYNFFVKLAIFIFFFQAEDGIRDRTVTGVQTCALPFLLSPYTLFRGHSRADPSASEGGYGGGRGARHISHDEIGRASCRERVYICDNFNFLKKKKITIL